MKTIFIINPAAGNGKAKKKWRRFKEGIRFPYEAVETAYAGHAAEMVRAFAESGEPALIIGFGGDGTMREILAGAAGAEQLIAGSVAAGSGNDFSRGFACFEDAKAIESFLEKPAARRQDLGEFRDSEPVTFVSSSGIGFDAEVTNRVNRSWIKKELNRFGFGKVAYFSLVAVSLVKFTPFTLDVRDGSDTRHFRDVWLATVNNQPYFGGGMKISPASKPDDGKLEITVVHGMTRLKLLLVFGTVFTGSHLRFKEVTQWRSSSFDLTTEQAVPRHTDGDTAGTTPEKRAVTYAVSRESWFLANNEQKEDQL